MSHQSVRVGLAIAISMAASTFVASAPTSAAPAIKSYIVQLDATPAVAYEGGLPGLERTAPEPGKKVDTAKAATRQYVDHLKALTKGVLAKVPGAKKLYEYSYTFPGFAAKMTESQAKQLGKLPGVARVTQSRRVHADTVSTPDYLNMRGAGGVWQQQQFGGGDNAGLEMIVGIIDTGIWPENPSFAALSSPRPDQATIDAKWHGSCQTGVTCNNKLIGAQWFRADPSGLEPEDLSPRDINGHGSHVAATAAGNRGVQVTNLGQNIGTASGMAPAARIASYKALFEDGGFDTDILAAIDKAVADGVDVINMSIGGGNPMLSSPTGVAAYFASAAGVYIAMSAGNNGPGPSTVGNTYPWVTTVAAATHNRRDTAVLTLGNGSTYTGASVSPAISSKPLRWANAVGGAPDQLCMPNTLNPALAVGKIIICDSGVNDPAEKAAEVKRAGGVAMVLRDYYVGTPRPTIAVVPVIAIRSVDFGPIGTYAGVPTATASFGPWSRSTITAPVIADFSSSGPDLISGGDLLKPDVAAPGVHIIAANSPVLTQTDFITLFGTSMAAPHIAGIATLILARHPTWTPSMVQSAMMTTAIQVNGDGNPILRDNGNVANPFHKGAGFVQPLPAFDPGLVYRAAGNGYRNYACALGDPIPGAGACPANPGDPSNLNYPSISIGDLSGSQQVTRRVTNVSILPGTYVPTIQVPPGFNATVSPPVLVLLPGAEATYTVTLTRTSASLGQYRFGAITWTDLLGHSVRSPIAVRPV